MKKFITRVFILFITTLFMQQLMQQETKACNVAVVSASASATGRPFIWKNRDHSESYRHQVLYFPAGSTVKYGSFRLMGETLFDQPDYTVCTGGANETGFAITNTTCVDPNTDLGADTNNVITDLMAKALEQCKTLSEFETVANNYKTYWNNKNISGICAVIDSYGGAAIYEMSTGKGKGNGKDLMFRKYDVDTGVVTDENGDIVNDYKYSQTIGFNNRTNSNHTKDWIAIVSDTPRENRARQLLSAMKLNNSLTPRNIMRYVSKDVCGNTPSDYFIDPDTNAIISPNLWDASYSKSDTYLSPNRDGEMFTGYCISRFQTTMGIVIEGAAAPDQANLTTMWVSLGEPSLSVFVPFFPYAEQVSQYATDNAHTNSGYYWDGVSSTSSTKATCFLNLLFDCVEANAFTNSVLDTTKIYNTALYNVYKNIVLYQNNGSGNYVDYGYRNDGGLILGTLTYKQDNTVNYPRLLSLQAWTLPLEDQVFNHTEEFLNLLRSDTSLISREELAKFSNYVCGFVYNNYSNQSASYAAWSYKLPDNGIAPTVISVDPSNGAVNPPVTNKVTVKFSEAIDAATINTGTFKLMNGSAVVNGSVVYDSVTHSATFTPDSTLATNSTYTVFLTTAIKDISGLSLAAEYTSNFILSSGSGDGDGDGDETDPDENAPVVTTVNTGNGGAVFPVDGAIVVQFSEPMDPNSININTFIVYTDDKAVSGTVVYDAATNTAVFTPDADLSGNTAYTVDLTTGIKDESGLSLPDDYIWSFTTSTEGTNPAITYISPADKEIDIVVDGKISAQFDKLMDETSINTSSFKVTYNSNTSVDGSVAYDPVNRTAVFTSGSRLKSNTVYTVELTADIKDNQGKFIKDTIWTFTTGSGSDISSNASAGSSGGGCGCGSAAEAATSGSGAQPLFPGLVSLLGMMLFPLSLISIHRKSRKKFKIYNS